MAGKTGTNDDRSQTWFMGYNSDMATATWLGNWKANSVSLSDLQIGGQIYEEIDGGFVAAPSWERFMQQISDRYPAEEFADPPQRMINAQRPTTQPGNGNRDGRPGNSQGDPGNSGPPAEAPPENGPANPDNNEDEG